MSLAGDVIKQRLGEVAGVTAIVGVPPNDRIHKFWIPQKPTYPAIAYKEIGSNRLKGTYSNPGYAQISVQVVCLAKTADGVNALSEQARLALERFGSSQPAGIPYAGTTLYDIVPGSFAEGYDQEAEAFFVTQDWTVEHLEVSP